MESHPKCLWPNKKDNKWLQRRAPHDGGESESAVAIWDT